MASQTAERSEFNSKLQYEKIEFRNNILLPYLTHKRASLWETMMQESDEPIKWLSILANSRSWKSYRFLSFAFFFVPNYRTANERFKFIEVIIAVWIKNVAYSVISAVFKRSLNDLNAVFFWFFFYLNYLFVDNKNRINANFGGREEKSKTKRRMNVM